MTEVLVGLAVLLFCEFRTYKFNQRVVEQLMKVVKSDIPNNDFKSGVLYAIRQFRKS